MPTRVWETITRLRLGASSRVLEVLLEEACPETPTVDAGAPVPLYIADPTPWLPPIPARPAHPALP